MIKWLSVNKEWNLISNKIRRIATAVWKRAQELQNLKKRKAQDLEQGNPLFTALKVAQKKY